MTIKTDERDRLRINTEDGLETAMRSGDSYLGNPETVTQLVRDFFVAVFSARAAFQESADGDAANERINEVCRQYGERFMGGDKEFTPMPWNSPARLGNFLRAVVPDVGDYATPGEAYFQYLAVQALNASIAIEEGTMSEDEVQAEMSEVVDDAVSVLMGTKAGAQV